MPNGDTVKLLKECNAGVKMGVTSIEEILPHVKSEKLKELLTHNKEEHQTLGSRLHEILNKYGESGKDPNPVAKGMSFLKTNLMMQMKDSDKTVADLMTDGCNMGVKSLNRYLNQYASADEEAKGITKELIDLEHHLAEKLRVFL